MAPRSAEATRDRILQAAFREFTRQGFAGARVDEIARRAKVNKALIYRHYADKERLFKHVLECKMAELGRLPREPERLPDLAGEFFDFHAANPWLIRLMQWEALDFGGRAVPNEAERAGHFAEHVERIREAQRAGAVDETLDPRHTLATLMAVVTFWFAFPQVARMIAGGDPYSPQALAERRRHVVEVARWILEAR